jgi:hypothetical protein
MKQDYYHFLPQESNTSAPAAEVLAEECGEPIEWDQCDPIVQVHMPGAGHNHQLLWLGGQVECLLAPVQGMGMFAGHEHHGAGRDGVDVGERVEVQELHGARARTAGRLCQCGALWKGLYNI